MPVFQPQNEPEVKDEDKGKEWLCRCGETNPRSRKRCSSCSSIMEEVQLEQSQMEWDDLCKMLRRRKRSRSRSKSRKRGRKRRKSSSSSSSSSSSDARSKSKPRGSKSKSPGASARASTIDVSDSDKPEKREVNPEIEKAKSEALQKVLNLKNADLTQQDRSRQWRALLREWHPDKHENKELATAVFQFLQKAKSLITDGNTESK